MSYISNDMQLQSNLGVQELDNYEINLVAAGSTLSTGAAHVAAVCAIFAVAAGGVSPPAIAAEAIGAVATIVAIWG